MGRFLRADQTKDEFPGRGHHGGRIFHGPPDCRWMGALRAHDHRHRPDGGRGECAESILGALFDARCLRTANRPLPGGRVRPGTALVYGLVLGGGNSLSRFDGELAHGPARSNHAGVLRLYLYTAEAYSTLCTVVGAVPGAIPPMMGFTGCTGHLSPQALAVFAILFFWQMPHFLAIAILYRDDYRAGGFLMLPVVDTHLETTGRQIILYSLATLIVSLMPFGLQMAGRFYLASAISLGLAFLAFGIVCAVRRCASMPADCFWSRSYICRCCWP